MCVLYTARITGGCRLRGTVRAIVGQRSRGLGVRPIRHPGFQELAVFQATLGRRAFAAVLAKCLLSADRWIRQQAGAHRLARYCILRLSVVLIAYSCVAPTVVNRIGMDSIIYYILLIPMDTRRVRLYILYIPDTYTT